jgi:hypothetical protein
LIKSFKVSQDKHYVEKMRDVVGFYINPQDKPLVLCVGEKSEAQTRKRGLHPPLADVGIFYNVVHKKISMNHMTLTSYFFH